MTFLKVATGVARDEGEDRRTPNEDAIRECEGEPTSPPGSNVRRASELANCRLGPPKKTTVDSSYPNIDRCVLAQHT